ncbi:MAG: hypothetical protein M0R06_00430 [Sphaerochaeta sp.]|jgi:hypothetical protein|nr:hypothetical protein [Sphaerochaeta sp.]
MKLQHPYKRKLNGSTPQWFKDWYTNEFMPIKVRQDIMIVLLSGIFISIMILFAEGIAH